MKMTNAVQNNRYNEVKKPVVNFMGGTSFEINPLDTLKMVSASSIFGEPAYYRNGQFAEKTIKDGMYSIDRHMTDYVLDAFDAYKGMTTSAIMEKAIDSALDYDYKAVLDWAVVLRNTYLMRLNPQVIMVRAAMHKNRQDFTATHPGYFNSIQSLVMSRGDDVISQITYILFVNKSKKNIPNILKRSWANKISSLSRYELYKYRNHGIGLIDAIRICHASNCDIDELMKTGTVALKQNQKTWETLRAGGSTWVQILDSIKIPHMALLRNLRGIFKEIDDLAKCKEIMGTLADGVENGKQFPFRYYSAINAVDLEYSVNHKATIKDGLEDCMDNAVKNLPTLKGKNAFLSDNSGSAWGGCASEYGSIKVAEIGNLSAVIGAANSDEGVVFPFGDKLSRFDVSKRQGILHQANDVTKLGKKCGMSTECGIWLFFEKAIANKEHWDNIFIYSDMQAGHGGLYGTDSALQKYKAKGFATNSRYIDVPKLIDAYRKEVNPKVNVYCIQTAGYSNVLVPEYAYRCNILYGWTGKELLFADAMNKFWDDKDKETEARKNQK